MYGPVAKAEREVEVYGRGDFLSVYIGGGASGQRGCGLCTGICFGLSGLDLLLRRQRSSDLSTENVAGMCERDGHHDCICA